MQQYQHHSRDSSSASIIKSGSISSINRLADISYVQHMRMAKATVWAERGPKDAVSDVRKSKVAPQKKGKFGHMKVRLTLLCILLINL